MLSGLYFRSWWTTGFWEVFCGMWCASGGGIMQLGLRGAPWCVCTEIFQTYAIHSFICGETEQFYLVKLKKVVNNLNQAAILMFCFKLSGMSSPRLSSQV